MFFRFNLVRLSLNSQGVYGAPETTQIKLFVLNAFKNPNERR